VPAEDAFPVPEAPPDAATRPPACTPAPLVPDPGKAPPVLPPDAVPPAPPTLEPPSGLEQAASASHEASEALAKTTVLLFLGLWLTAEG
jgi:hypothetical protein